MGTDDRIDKLTTTATDLQTSIDTLTRRLRANRRGTAFAIIIAVILGAVVVDEVDISRRVRESLAQNYVTAQQQQATRTRVLCPLYSVLVVAAASSAKAPGLTPAQQARLAASVKIVEDGYTALGCLPPLAG